MFGDMLGKFMLNKSVQKKADADATQIFKVVNAVKNRFPVVLTFDFVWTYTLMVAYGERTGMYIEEELPELKNKLYFSSISNGKSSAQRGQISIMYDKYLSEHYDYFRKYGTDDLKPRIKEILEDFNKANSDQPNILRNTSDAELQAIEDIFNTIEQGAPLF